jgi:hypothetical protein
LVLFNDNNRAFVDEYILYADTEIEGDHELQRQRWMILAVLDL